MRDDRNHVLTLLNTELQTYRRRLAACDLRIARKPSVADQWLHDDYTEIIRSTRWAIDVLERAAAEVPA
jgi:hypothetical protein